MEGDGGEEEKEGEEMEENEEGEVSAAVSSSGKRVTVFISERPTEPGLVVGGRGRGLRQSCLPLGKHGRIGGAVTPPDGRRTLRSLIYLFIG